MVNFYLTPFGGRVYYKWKFCPSVCLFVCLSVITSYFTDISVSVAQIKKIQNTRWVFFILLLVGPSPHSQLVPKHLFFLQISRYQFEFCFWEDPHHPVNWSPTHSTGPQTLFFTYILVSVAQIKQIKKTWCIFSSNFASGRTLPNQSTGLPVNRIISQSFLLSSPIWLIISENIWLFGIFLQVMARSPTSVSADRV